MRLHPKILSKNGKKLFAVLPYEEHFAFQTTCDAEDPLALRKAKRSNDKKCSAPLTEIA